MTRSKTTYNKLFQPDNLYALSFAVFVFLALTQNFLSIILSGVNPSLAKLCLISKEAYLFVILTFLLLKEGITWLRSGGRLHRGILIGAGLSVYLAVSCLLSNNLNLMSLRQLLIIPLLLLFGFLLANHTTLKKICAFLLPLLLLTAVSGYLERFVLHDEQEVFWQFAGIYEYMKLKGFEMWAYGPGGTPGNFYSYDFAGLIEHPVRRMNSIFLAEPTLLGQLLVFPILYAFLSHNILLLGLFGVAMLLTLSKGGLLGVIIGIYFHFSKNKSNLLTRTALFASVATLLFLVTYLAYTGAVNSLANHFFGLYISFAQLIEFPLGKGIGGAGNFAILTASNAGEDLAALGIAERGESYLGAIAGQLGIIGIALYGYLAYSIFKTNTSTDWLSSAVKYSLLATLISGVASESAISYVGTGYLFVLAAFILKGNHGVTTDAR